MVSRVPVLEVRPCIERGTRPARLVVGEPLEVEALVAGESADVVGADVVLVDPAGTARAPVPLVRGEDDVWRTTVVADAPGSWRLHVRSWLDPVRTWAAGAVDDLDHGADPDAVLAHGSRLLATLGAQDPAAFSIGEDLLDTEADPVTRLAEALAYLQTLPEEIGRVPQETSPALPVLVEEPGALVGAWYQTFPRSDGAHRGPDGAVVGGTLATATKRLEQIAAMGFDTVHLPPLHPRADESPWSVGTSAGGHEAVDPELGTHEDVQAYVERARQLDLHVALELSWDAASSHPWVSEHPHWYVPTRGGRWRLDVASDAAAIAEALETVVRTWVADGIQRFVMADAARQPAGFWGLLHERLADVPGLVTVAAGDMTRVQAHALTTAGFTQVTPPLHRCVGVNDVARALHSITRATVRRPHLQIASAHRLPEQLASAAEPHVRPWTAVAALASPTWSTCAGLERLEPSAVRHGHRRVADVEGPVVREDGDRPAVLAELYARLNELRRLHPALRSRRGLQVHPLHHAGVLAFTRRAEGDEVTVVADLFPSFEKSLGLSADLLTRDDGRVQDQLDGSWHRLDAVRLDPAHPVRVLTRGR